jgi:hypothetical protein
MGRFCFSAFALTFALGAFASGASAGEPDRSPTLASQVLDRNMVVAFAMTPATLPVESDVVPAQFKKKGFKKGPGPGIVRRGHRRGRYAGRAIGLGIGAAFLGTVLATEAARANARRTCERWAIQCDNGSGRACARFDANCL